MSVLAVLAPLFLGPIGFLLSTLVVVGAVVVGALWLLGALSGPPGLG